VQLELPGSSMLPRHSPSLTLRMESTTPDLAILSIMESGRTGLEPKAEAL
jgi:hypothetical protein